MDKIFLKIILLSSLFVLVVSLIAFAQPSEKRLVEAWEVMQKNDPKTVVFEKSEENHYKFKTERFPFDGELKILNVSIDDRMKDFENGYIMGVIEVELVDLPKEFLQKYSYSYSIWTQNNILYYDKENNKWLTTNEYYAKVQKKFEKNPFTWFWSIFTNMPTIIFIVFIIFLIIVLGNIQKKNKVYIDYAKSSTDKSLELIQKSLNLNEDSNRVLKEILEILKSKK